MPEEPKKETLAHQAPELTCNRNAMRGQEGNDDEPFPYFLKIGDVYDGPLDVLLAIIKKQNPDIYDLLSRPE